MLRFVFKRYGDSDSVCTEEEIKVNTVVKIRSRTICQEKSKKIRFFLTYRSVFVLIRFLRMLIKHRIVREPALLHMQVIWPDYYSEQWLVILLL